MKFKSTAFHTGEKAQPGVEQFLKEAAFICSHHIFGYF